MNDLLKSGANAILIVVIMVFGSLVLWIGVPVFWLWVGGQVQGATQEIGLALLVAAVGAFATIAALVALLGWLNRKTVELREARGFKVKPGTTPLEIVMAICASIAIACFGFWFFVLGGSSPIPLMGQGG